MSKHSIRFRVLPDGVTQKTVGRTAWALEELVRAGDAGITSVTSPGPRLSHYIMCLRRKHSLAIETVDEKHAGQFAGVHGRYKLRSSVEILGDELRGSA